MILAPHMYSWSQMSKRDGRFLFEGVAILVKIVATLALLLISMMIGTLWASPDSDIGTHHLFAWAISAILMAMVHFPDILDYAEGGIHD